MSLNPTFTDIYQINLPPYGFHGNPRAVLEILMYYSVWPKVGDLGNPSAAAISLLGGPSLPGFSYIFGFIPQVRDSGMF